MVDRGMDEREERFADVSETDAQREDASALGLEGGERMRQLEAERDEALAKYKRALADFQNFQRRSTTNEQMARQRGMADVLRAILTPLEHLDLAVSQQPPSEAERRLLDGVRMVRDEFVRALGSAGVSRVEVKPGDVFDPSRHEAIMMADAPGLEANRVAQQIQPGYAVGDILVRPARVALSKGDSDAAESEAANPT